MSRGLMKLLGGLLLAAGALALFGCGGDSSGSSLSKADFTKKVNQLCKEEDSERKQAKVEKQEELGLQPGELANSAQHKQIVEVTVSPYEVMTERIRELLPPALEDKMKPLIKAREELAETVRATGPPSASFLAIQKANVLASKNGLDECSI